MSFSLPHIDLSNLSASEEVKSLLVELLNVIESQGSEIRRLEGEVLSLGNELRILKGGNAIPAIAAEKSSNHSSEGREEASTKKKSEKRKRKYPKLR